MYTCQHCGSARTEVQADTIVCSDCGKVSDFKGRKVEQADLQNDRHINEVEPQDYQPDGSPAGSSRTPDGVWDHGTKLVAPQKEPYVDTGEGVIERGTPIGTDPDAGEDADLFAEEREATEGDRMNTTESSGLTGSKKKK